MDQVKKNWWKLTGIVLLLYVIVGGLLFDVPQLDNLLQSIRSIYFHVGMWFGMIFILGVGLVFSIRYLSTSDPKDDLRALSAVKTGLLFGFLGLLTGMIWAKFTWGAFWLNDPKLNGAVVGVFIYLAYMVLRSSVDDREKRAKLAAVYSIFAFVLFIVFIMILPRTATFSIHPGIESNPALVPGDLAAEMRPVFYPAMIAWFIMSYWLYRIMFRVSVLAEMTKELSENKKTEG